MRKLYTSALAAVTALALISSVTVSPANAGSRKHLVIVAVPAAGAVLGAVAARHAWLGAHASRLVSGSALGGAATGFVAGVAALVGYEAIVCKTLGQDPLDLGCKQLTWRDPSWRG